MREPEKILQTLTDVQIVSLAKRLSGAIYATVPYATVHSHVVRDVEGLDTLTRFNSEAKRKMLDSVTSVEATRRVLAAYAKDPDLGRLLVEEWEALKRDDTLFVGESVVALGLIANLVLFLATTELEFKKGNFKFKKKAAGADVLRELMKPMTELVKKIGVGS